MNRTVASRALLFVALGVAVAIAYTQRHLLDTVALERWVAGAGMLGPAVYMAIYAAATVLFVPGSVITLAGGALFGPVWGTLYSLTGATIGASAAFFIARYLASDWVSSKATGWMKQIVDGVEAEGWRFVAFARLMPLFPFNLLNYVLGLTRVSPVQYIVASYVFMFPGAFAYTYLGYAGREALGGGEEVLRKGLLALALLAVVAFLPRLIGRVREARAARQLSAAQLRARLARHEDVNVLDVRPARDYTGELGHIDASLNIPLDQLPGRLPELDHLRERPIAVICRTNRMSIQAVELLRRAGFRRVQLVTDGMLAWRQQDHA
jgi:uncharacterized membrane protein YdjX (TVP38/TMEM64 family)